ncbi:MAG: 6,7-dimethyl-8-ribityllumazine synthase [Balneolaceae bacterium]
MAITIVDGKTMVSGAKVGIVVSRWNSSITEKMLEGALKVLNGNGIKDDNILIVRCPGSFEIPLTAQHILEEKEVDGVIALGVVIRGGTPHFEYVCDAVTQGVLNLNLNYQKPVAFGVLTTDDVKQAIDRAGEKGNKGGEAALALLEMIDIKRKLSNK